MTNLRLCGFFRATSFILSIAVNIHFIHIVGTYNLSFIIAVINHSSSCRCFVSSLFTFSLAFLDQTIVSFQYCLCCLDTYLSLHLRLAQYIFSLIKRLAQYIFSVVKIKISSRLIRWWVWPFQFTRIFERSISSACFAIRLAKIFIDSFVIITILKIRGRITPWLIPVLSYLHVWFG